MLTNIHKVYKLNMIHIINMREEIMNNVETQKIQNLIKDIKFVMMLTIEKDGSFHSRPMGTIKSDDFKSLWFFTADDSLKTLEISHNSQVNLSYVDPDSNTFVSIYGKGRIIKHRHKIKELWNPFLKAWFPKGVNDPNICLIEVNPIKAEYWTYPDSTLYMAFQYIKKIATGKNVNLGENKKVDIN
jgi:general stress protein 26